MRQRIVELLSQTAPAEQAAQARALVGGHGNIVADLIALGFAPTVVLEACSTATGIPAAEMKWLRNPKISGDVDAVLCRQVQAAPVAVVGGELVIAYADPEMAAQGSDLGFPPHRAVLCAPAHLQMALSLLETSDTAPLPPVTQAPAELEDRTAAIPTPSPAPPQGSDAASPSPAPARPAVATIPGSTVPQLPGAARPSQSFIPIAPIKPPTSSAPVVPVTPAQPPPLTVRPAGRASALVAPMSAAQPAQIEDVTGDVAFGIAPRPEVTNSGMRPKVDVTGVRAKVEVTGVRAKVEVTNGGAQAKPEPSGPKEVPQRRELSTPKEMPERRESAAEGESSLPKMRLRGGLTVAKAGDVKVPEPKALPMPPKIADKLPFASPSAAGTSSSSPGEKAAAPTSGGVPLAQKWEPLDPVVEPVNAKRSDKGEKAERSDKNEKAAKAEKSLGGGLLDVGSVVAADGGGSVGKVRVPIAAAIGVIVVVLVAVAVIALRPAAEPARNDDAVIAQQVSLVAKGKQSADPVAAIALFDEAIKLDMRTTGARDALLARAQLAMKLGLADLARDDVARLKRRSDIEPIANDVDRVLAAPAVPPEVPSPAVPSPAASEATPDGPAPPVVAPPPPPAREQAR